MFAEPAVGADVEFGFAGGVADHFVVEDGGLAFGL